MQSRENNNIFHPPGTHHTVDGEAVRVSSIRTENREWRKIPFEKLMIKRTVSRTAVDWKETGCVPCARSAGEVAVREVLKSVRVSPIKNGSSPAEIANAHIYYINIHRTLTHTPPTCT